MALGSSASSGKSHAPTFTLPLHPDTIEVRLSSRDIFRQLFFLEAKWQ